jgi:crossover junction endodeoxyribonuclease RusA
MTAQNPYVTIDPNAPPIIPVAEPPSQPAMPPTGCHVVSCSTHGCRGDCWRELSIFVPGVPAPQGSKRHVGNGVMVESSKRVKPWRQDVREAALATGVRITGPVSVDLLFVMPRPKSAKPGQAADKRPDLDKLVRAVLDALTSAGTFEDDARVVSLLARKALTQPGLEMTGCAILVRSCS